MRKLFALILGIVYMTMTNAVIHAQSMGLFSDMEMQDTHCHSTDTSSKDQHVDCCDLVYSSQYSQSNIKIISVSKFLSFAISPVSIPTDVFLDKIALYKPDFSLHP
jgi:hypothetical protein